MEPNTSTSDVLHALKNVIEALSSHGVSLTDISKRANVPYDALRLLVKRDSTRPRMNQNSINSILACLQIIEEINGSQRDVFEADKRNELEVLRKSTAAALGLKPPIEIAREKFDRTEYYAHPLDPIKGIFPEISYFIRRRGNEKKIMICPIKITRTENQFTFQSIFPGQYNDRVVFGRILQAGGTIYLMGTCYQIATDVSGTLDINEDLIDLSSQEMSDLSNGVETIAFPVGYLRTDEFDVVSLGVDSRASPISCRGVFVNGFTRKGEAIGAFLNDAKKKWIFEFDNNNTAKPFLINQEDEASNDEVSAFKIACESILQRFAFLTSELNDRRQI